MIRFGTIVDPSITDTSGLKSFLASTPTGYTFHSDPQTNVGLPSEWVVIDKNKNTALSHDSKGYTKWIGQGRDWTSMGSGGWKLMMNPKDGKWWVNSWDWQPQTDKLEWSDTASVVKCHNGKFIISKTDLIGYHSIPKKFSFVDIYQNSWSAEIVKRHVSCIECKLVGSEISEDIVLGSIKDIKNQV
jgi:hypothetical protein